MFSNPFIFLTETLWSFFFSFLIVNAFIKKTTFSLILNLFNYQNASGSCLTGRFSAFDFLKNVAKIS